MGDEFREDDLAALRNLSAEVRRLVEQSAAARRRLQPVQLNVRIEAEIKATADLLAADLKCSVADVVERAIEQLAAQRTP